jgi:hypothetical protein
MKTNRQSEADIDDGSDDDLTAALRSALASQGVTAGVAQSRCSPYTAGRAPAAPTLFR